MHPVDHGVVTTPHLREIFFGDLSASRRLLRFDAADYDSPRFRVLQFTEALPSRSQPLLFLCRCSIRSLERRSSFRQHLGFVARVRSDDPLIDVLHIPLYL